MYTFRSRLISGFHHQVDENRALLGYYAASSGNSFPTFRDDLPVPRLGTYKLSRNFDKELPRLAA
jgi:hypothetical protein